MSNGYTIAVDARPAAVAETTWLRSRTWDLTFVSLSAALVAVPILTYLFANHATGSINAFFSAVGIKYTWDDDASRNLVNGFIALFIGGPHMYATYTRTALDTNFTHKHKLFLGVSLLIPIGVIILGVNYFQFLITFFFFWASIHIMHQMAFIMECYNKKARIPISKLDRFVDYGVVFSSLYPIATYKFIHGEFWIGSNKILFPDFLKTDYLFYLVTAFFAASLVLFVVKTVKEILNGTANYPKILLMSLTVVVAFFIPSFRNLDVAFQGFNAWHSFQYLGLTFYINTLRHQKGEIGTKFIDEMSEAGKSWMFYFFNVGLTVIAVTIIAFLIFFKTKLGLSFDQCYYIVVLSFLLMHYFHDHLLFTEPEAILSA
jgi:hypothetical protein